MARLPRYLAFLVLVLIPCIANAASSSTFLLLQSQPGDTVGQGQTVAFTTASGPFTVQGNANAVTVSFHTSDNTQTWTLSFSAVTGAALGHSEYEGAIRVASSAQPGLLVTGNGHGCTTVTGRFMGQITFAQNVVTDWAGIVQPAILTTDAGTPRPPASSQVLHARDRGH